MENPKIEKLRIAVAEAERFIDRAERALARLEKDKYACVTGTKEMGAAKRASMDLTRVLVEVRKPV